MKRKMRKMCAVTAVIVLLPYIITVFLNKTSIEANQNNQEAYVKVKTDSEIINVSLEEYCIGTLAKEVSSDYEEEMLKVQSVLVRTTVYKEIAESKEHVLEDTGFYRKKDMESRWYEKLRDIWYETDGQVLMYNNELALVPFHQLSNGQTRDARELLGSKAYPYLTSKECPQDKEASLQMESKILPVSSIEILEIDSAGYVTSVKLGEETCSGENFRDAYGLSSSCFEVQEWNGQIRVTTMGVGHGLGLSQYTANEMAKEGRTHQEILEYFFEGTEIREVAEILLSVE